jgi:hypothetical protein
LSEKSTQLTGKRIEETKQQEGGIGERTLKMKRSCSSALVAILTACLDRISLAWSLCDWNEPPGNQNTGNESGGEERERERERKRERGLRRGWD